MNSKINDPLMKELKEVSNTPFAPVHSINLVFVQKYGIYCVEEIIA
jgi:hypothetical protein